MTEPTEDRIRRWIAAVRQALPYAREMTEPTRRLCAHAHDDDPRPMHWLEPGEQCTPPVPFWETRESAERWTAAVLAIQYETETPKAPQIEPS